MNEIQKEIKQEIQQEIENMYSCYDKILFNYNLRLEYRYCNATNAYITYDDFFDLSDDEKIEILETLKKLIYYSDYNFSNSIDINSDLIAHSNDYNLRKIIKNLYIDVNVLDNNQLQDFEDNYHNFKIDCIINHINLIDTELYGYKEKSKFILDIKDKLFTINTDCKDIELALKKCEISDYDDDDFDYLQFYKNYLIEKLLNKKK